MPALNQRGHRAECYNHAPIRNRVACHSLNRETGQVERQEWETPWLEGCPHWKVDGVGNKGNAALYQWDCDGCRWGE